MSEVHRVGYAREAAARAEHVERCYIEPKLPPKWIKWKKCVPNTAEACKFEDTPISEMHATVPLGQNTVYGGDKSKPREYAEKQGWKYLGCGMGRCAFLFRKKASGEWDDCVVKFGRSERKEGVVRGAEPFNPPRSMCPWAYVSVEQRGRKAKCPMAGTEQNSYEASVFDQCEERVTNMLLPVVAHSAVYPYKWVVQPKVITDKEDSSINDNSVERVVDKFEALNAQVFDAHPGNFGKLDGDLIMIDYGFRFSCPHKARKLEPLEAIKAGEAAKGMAQLFPEPERVVSPKAKEPFGMLVSPPTIQQKCEKHRDCPVGMMCVSPKFVTHPRYCKKSRELTKEDVLREIARVNKRFHEIPPSYRSDVKYGVDESLKTAEKEMNKGDLVMALFNVESAENEIAAEKSKLLSIGVTTYRTPKPMPVARRFKPKPQDIKRAQIMDDMAKVVSKEGRSFDAVYLREQADKIREFGVQAIRPYDDKMIVSLLDPEHRRQVAEIVGRGRHGLKRPRAEKGGELTQKRRVLWARAGELRRHAKALEGSMKKQMVDEARFLEQQAWHYQTKQVKSGRAPLSDPVKMMRILHPEQRQLFEPEMKKAMSQTALQELWIPRKGGMSE